MNELLFLKQREPDWKRLTQLSDRADASVSQLKPEDLADFVRLYRRACDDLALVRTESTNDDLATFLNALCARAYSMIYRTTHRPLGAVLIHAIALSASTVRRRIGAIALSAGVFLGSALFAYACLIYVPGSRDVLVPPEFEGLVEEWKQGEMQEQSGLDSVGASAFYASNNPTVSILASSIAAATFGVGTASILYSNGLMLGTLSHEMASVGKLGFLLLHVMPHGVTELSGIIVSGGAGFLMAWALIHPGRRRRADALREAGKDALVLLVTAVVLMFIAAPIEGFVSFNAAVPNEFRAVLIFGTAIGWGAFWMGFARDFDSREATESRLPTALR
ncbi:MAG: hypothetical protein DCC46_07875 [Armatimonadetes bacterium]|nr:MAG: hypothetical protein DCC46_07875 [Armatimonadota bacterium]